MEVKMEKDKKSMLEIIQDLCYKRGVTIAELERKANLGNGTIRRWDKSYPSIDKVMRVARVFNVSLEYLYNGTEENVLNAAARKMEELDESEIKSVNELIDLYLMRKSKL